MHQGREACLPRLMIRTLRRSKMVSDLVSATHADCAVNKGGGVGAAVRASSQANGSMGHLGLQIDAMARAASGHEGKRPGLADALAYAYEPEADRGACPCPAGMLCGA